MTGRRFLGVELKPEYFRASVGNLTAAAVNSGQGQLFADAGTRSE